MPVVVEKQTGSIKKLRALIEYNKIKPSINLSRQIF